MLLASVISDPFSGDPLLIDRLTDEWVVYSIGEDGRDDGGDILHGTNSMPADIGLGPLGPPLAAPADEVESDD